MEVCHSQRYKIQPVYCEVRPISLPSLSAHSHPFLKSLSFHMPTTTNSSSSSSSMSFLDQIFGTDGRKHKEDGVWNWIKHQKNKRSRKGPSQLDSYGNSTTSNSGDKKENSSSWGDESQQVRVVRPSPQHLHSRSNSRCSNLSTATTATSQPYLCRTPTSPTSTFVPSYSSSFSSFSSASSSTSSVTAVTTPTLLAQSNTPTVRPPVHQQQQPQQQPPRQRAQSTFTQPGTSTSTIAPSTSFTTSIPSRQQPTFSSNSFTTPSPSQTNGTIKRSVSVGSTPSSARSRVMNQQQERPRRQRWSSGSASFVSSRTSPRILEEGEVDEGEGNKNDEWWWE